MKISKKILISSLALVLTFPAVGIFPTQRQNNIVQAARSSKTGYVELTNHSSQFSVPLVNRKDKEISGKSLKSISKVKFYGKPVIVNVHYPADTFPPFRIGDRDFRSLGDGGYIKESAAGTTTNKGTMKLNKNAYVYNKKGQRLRTYRGRRAILYKNTYIKYGGKTYYTIPQSFFNLGQGRYLAARYVAQMNGKPLLTLNNNTYLYNRKGKRIGRSKLLRGSVVTTNSKIRNASANDQYYFYKNTDENSKAKSTFVTKKIRGQSYLSLGKGAYIKIANVQTANGMILFTKGPITIKDRNVELYDSHFKKIKQTLKAGTKLTLDKTVIDTSYSDPQLNFRIKGTNHLVYWGDYGEYPGAQRTANFDPDYADPYDFWFKQFME